MNTPSPAETLHPKARRGFDLFNQGDFFQAHEDLEAAWMESPSPARDLYQGVLQIGLAYLQIDRGNYRGALKMFRRGHRNLDPLGKSLLGVDIFRFQEDARRVEAELRRLGPGQVDQLDWKLIKALPGVCDQ